MKHRLIRWLLGACLTCCAGSLLAAEVDVAPERKISPSDVLNIFVVGEKELPNEFQVSSAGTIQFPFLDTVDVKDKSCEEVGNRLKELLGKDYFVDPQVVVSIRQFKKQFVRVIGQVARPGLIELPNDQRFDIIDAIAAAQGLTNLGDKDKITLTRKGRNSKYSLNKLKEIKDPAQKVWLEADDTVEVGQSVF